MFHVRFLELSLALLKAARAAGEASEAAARKQQEEKVKRILSSISSPNMMRTVVNYTDEEGESSLFFACLGEDNINIVLALLSKGCDVNTQTNDNHDIPGDTPLIESCLNGHVEIAKALLSHNANVGLQRKSKLDATLITAQKGHFEILELLTEKDPSYVDRKGPLGKTPLITCAFNGHLRIVRALTEKWNVNVNAQDDCGDTALYCASQENHIEVVDYLLQHGANPKLCNKKGDKALKIATEKNNKDIVKLLKRYM